MRVDERSLSEQVSSTAARAGETQRIQVGGSNASGAAAAASADHVDLSGLTGRISSALAATSKQAAQRVGQLQQEYRAGRYQPDARALSRAMTES